MTHINISKMSKLLKHMYKEYKNDKPSNLQKKMKKMRGGNVFPIPTTSMINISSLDMKSFSHPHISSLSQAPHSNFAM